MRSLKSLSILTLLFLGVSFAGANVWFAAARSTIPLELSGNVTRKQRLIEKTPGVDDACLVELDSSRRIQVDGAVFDALIQNRVVSKSAWSQTIKIDGRDTDLSWSPDFRGMLWAMPLTVLVFVVFGSVLAAVPSAQTSE